MQEWITALKKGLPDKTTQNVTSMDLSAFLGKDETPTEWIQCFTDEGYEYWFNQKNGETSWEKPK
jgi:hypothetical protein